MIYMFCSQIDRYNSLVSLFLLDINLNIFFSFSVRSAHQNDANDYTCDADHFQRFRANRSRLSGGNGIASERSWLRTTSGSGDAIVSQFVG